MQIITKASLSVMKKKLVHEFNLTLLTTGGQYTLTDRLE